MEFHLGTEQDQYLFVCLMANPHVEVRGSEHRVTGVLAVAHKMNGRVAESATQTPPDEIGIDTFEFWRPDRRPKGHNLAVDIEPPLDAFGASNVINGVSRPVLGVNAWVADQGDPAPALTLAWDAPQRIRRIELTFDTDWDHPLESVLMGHPERVMPFCVRRCRVLDDAGRELARLDDNHQTCWRIELNEAIETRRLRIECEHPSETTPAAIFEVRCYGD